MVLVDQNGAGVDGGKPSAEADLHARVAALTGAGAVIHVHTVASVAMGRREPGYIVFKDLEMLKGVGQPAHGTAVTLPVIGNSQDMKELGDRLEAARDPRMPTVLVAGTACMCGVPRRGRRGTTRRSWSGCSNSP